MKKLKKAVKLLLCASLMCSIGLSATACNVDKDPEDKDDGNQIETPGGNQGGSDDNIFTPPDDGSEGIDWTKYWDGVLNTDSSADNFKFTGSKDIGTISGNFVPDTSTGSSSEDVTVKFSDGVAEQIIENGGLAVKPVTPENSGYMFAGWYSDSNYSNEYDFSAPVTKNLNLYAKWTQLSSSINSVKGFNESLAVTWSGSANGASVEYKPANGNAWKSVDAPLIRNVNGEARVDIVGLSAGKYNVRINGSELPAPVTVDSYDRSGYAHFNRKSTEASYEGVGAYKDDGTLKDGALVIYVNDGNKNDISDSVYRNTANGLVKEDISSYFWTDLNGTVQKGIGYLLNNRQYRNNTEREQKGIQALSDKYGAVAVRFLGEIVAEDPATVKDTSKLVQGLTAYNSTEFGGTVGDNGRMARITNAKNITVEGIGEDAEFWGWGIHFVSNDNLHKYQSSGTSFEARNLTFTSYPEDALGMEGTQGTKVDQSTGSITGGASSAEADLISPVERCWIHNNVFNQGGCENAAESDKKEGDGSCDFKRGQYYTLSYNYFTDCHKTNLVGSSDTSLSYNVSIHHNWYHNVQSRQPLTRRANVHYYNNYVSDASDYVTSFRANCLVFSEANYYDGCKNITQKKDGEGVAWGNIYYSSYSENNYTELTSRTQTVANNCKFIGRNIDYTKFYIESDKFYYDSENEVSDCLLDSAVGARIRVMLQAGVHGFGKVQTDINVYTPDNTVSVGSVTLPTTKPSATSGAVQFNGITGTSSGTIKGKGQIATFSLSGPTELSVTTTTVGDSAPELIQSNGRVWANKFTGSLTIVLPKGTYVIASGQKDKEATITSLKFADTAASSEARIANAKAALAEIPAIITMNSESVIAEAQKAYNALLANERSEIANELYERYAKAVEALSELEVDYVIARIDHIGTVDVNSYNRINAAQTAYSKLHADKQSQITNYSTLTAAWAAYDGFAAQNVINKMLDLPDLSQAKVKSTETLDKLKDWFNAVNVAFVALSSDQDGQTGQQSQVIAHNNGSTYKKLTDGLAEIEMIEKLLEFKDILANTNAYKAQTDGATLLSLHKALTDAYKAQLSADEKAKYDSIIAIYNEYASKAVSVTFIGGKPSSDLFKHTGAKQNAKNSKFTVHAYSETEQLASGLKFESSTELTLTLTAKMTVTFYMFDSNSVAVNGNAVALKQENGDNVATVTLEAGAHKITRAKSEAALYYVVIAPVA